jgi:hypothetical protein
MHFPYYYVNVLSYLIYISGTFDTKDGSVKFVPLDNFPSGSDAILDETTAVYVPNLNRIYIFGGVQDVPSRRIWRRLNDIWCVDLPPPTPSPTLPLLNGSNHPDTRVCAFQEWVKKVQ